MTRRKILLAVISIVIVSLGSCTKKEDKISSSKKDTITAYVGTSIFDSSLDPIKGAMCYGYPFTNNALLKVNSSSEYVGDLATDWSISEDAMTYTFHLKRDVKFSDGSEFDAQDVVFTYETVKNQPAMNETIDLKRLKSIEAMDHYTVEFHLEEAYSPFFDMIAQLQIVPSDTYHSEVFDTQPIGTGAWKVVQYDVNQQIILEPNEYYFGDTPAINKVTLVYMDNESAFAAAKSGQLDIVMVGANYATENIDGMTAVALETMDVRNINLPVLEEQTMKNAAGEEVLVGNNVTADKAVREALSIGIHRQTIINNAFNGIGVPAVNFTDNLVWASTETYEDGRIEDATKLLEDAGWIDSNGDGIREKNQLKCSFDVYAPGGDNDRYLLAVAVAEDARKLGIELNVKTASWDEILQYENRAGIVWGWGQYSPTVLNAMFHSSLFLDGGYDNVSGLNSPAVDAKIQEAITASNQEEAIKAWKEVQRLADAEYPNLYLVNIEHCYFINNNLDISIDTQIPHPHGHGSPIICNMSEWKYK